MPSAKHPALTTFDPTRNRLDTMAKTGDAIKRALADHQAGRLAEAERAYREILGTNPDHASALHLLGLVAFQSGKLKEAEDLIRRAIRNDGRQAVFHTNLAAVHEAQGRLDDAAASLESALSIKPDLYDAEHSLGKILLAQGRTDEAVGHFQRAVAAKPDLGEAHRSLGIIHQSRGEWGAALDCCQRAVACDAEDARAHFHVGLAHHHLGQPEAAMSAYQHAIRIQPQNVEAHCNLGTIFQVLGKPNEAVACYRRALAANPDDGGVLSSLGDALRQLGEGSEALQCFQRALQVQPDHPEAHYNLGLLHLSQGRLAEGWPEFAWRLRCAAIPKRSFGRPVWQGEPLAGRTLLVHAEQGLGDTLQMLRYVSRAGRCGGQVLLGVPDALVELVEVSGFQNVLAAGGELPDFELEVPLLSLPGIFHTTLESLPGAIPYLSAEPERVRKWKDRLKGGSPFRVGVHWQGNPRHVADHFRSIPLTVLARLAEVPGVEWINLQKGVERSQVEDRFGADSVTNLAHELTNFHETAAVMQHLNLVIACDSAPAHLAGALGVPVWIALSKIADWRWFVDRDDSPWYPSARLFRQRTLGDWDDVFARIVRALTEEHERHALRPASDR